MSHSEGDALVNEETAFYNDSRNKHDVHNKDDVLQL